MNQGDIAVARIKMSNGNSSPSNDTKGDLEVIVNYMGIGLAKTRMKDVKMAEMPTALRQLFLAVLEGIVSSSQGKIPKNFFPVFGEEQFKGM